MKSILPVILIIFSFYSGSCQTKNDLIIDEPAKKIFSTTELEGIQSMIKFVDSCVVKETNLTDINEACHENHISDFSAYQHFDDSPRLVPQASG